MASCKIERPPATVTVTLSEFEAEVLASLTGWTNITDAGTLGKAVLGIYTALSHAGVKNQGNIFRPDRTPVLRRVI